MYYTVCPGEILYHIIHIIQVLYSCIIGIIGIKLIYECRLGGIALHVLRVTFHVTSHPHETQQIYFKKLHWQENTMTRYGDKKLQWQEDTIQISRS